MSENVFRDADGFGCCMDDEMEELPGVTAREYFAAEPTDHYGTLHEEIVRCRDCKNYEPKDGTWLNCRFEIDGFIQWRYAEPDGFCAWGEKKEGGE